MARRIEREAIELLRYPGLDVIKYTASLLHDKPRCGDVEQAEIPPDVQEAVERALGHETGFEGVRPQDSNLSRDVHQAGKFGDEFAPGCGS